MTPASPAAPHSAPQPGGPQPDASFAFTGLAGLAPEDPLDSARLMGVILALAGEVYLLKAELRRMRIALADRQMLDEQALDQAGSSAQMSDWLKREEAEFGQSLLRPFTHPDEAPNVSAAMRSR